MSISIIFHALLIAKMFRSHPMLTNGVSIYCICGNKCRKMNGITLKLNPRKIRKKYTIDSLKIPRPHKEADIDIFRLNCQLSEFHVIYLLT